MAIVHPTQPAQLPQPEVPAVEVNSERSLKNPDEPCCKRSTQWKALAMICVGVFGALSIWFSASAVLEPLTADWDITDAQGSFLTSMVSVGFCVGCLTSVATSLSDLVAPPKLIVVGALGASAANVSVLLIGSFYQALILRFVVGFSLSLVYPPAVKLLSTYFAAEERAMSIGIMFSAFCLGSAFPNLLKGAAAADSWRIVVAGTSATAVMGGILVILFVPVGPLPFPASGPFRLDSCWKAVRNPKVILAIVAYCGHQWELFCVWAWAGAFMQKSWLLSSTSAPLVAFVVIAMGGPGAWIGGLLGDKHGHVKVAAASLAMSGTCVAIIGLLGTTGPLFLRVAIFLIWGLTALADSPQFSALIIRNADQKYVGTAVTLQLLCGYLLTVVALWILPSVAASISWGMSFFSLAGGPAISLAALALLSILTRRASTEQNHTEEAEDVAPAVASEASLAATDRV
mmetsp:Transcript_65505/g.168589  ORF Transcript_65505/g.168589 Transcript_65505/m.168589 type:complete len:459 (+) Transcript_65505:26-1402(+)|eukprot:CAMPEP_0195157290 /NCGR_PEP_ID=MMETSP0448-20130528/185084_1 /TAXON_ID=66468 /ORGANISM="Heterocapsa triquestra, Strain CCMP 448" /LENGTH=458 /DNA_ID=CAMNT_0040196083 /DNA_START=26 /DNA_END=1402 /DNA_ORIENTATION=-